MFDLNQSLKAAVSWEGLGAAAEISDSEVWFLGINPYGEGIIGLSSVSPGCSFNFKSDGWISYSN